MNCRLRTKTWKKSSCHTRSHTKIEEKFENQEKMAGFEPSLDTTNIAVGEVYGVGPVFVLGGGRESLSASRMEELLASIPADLDPVSICLSNKSFTIEAAEVIARKLSQFKNIKQVDISDIIAGRPEDEALQVLTLIADSLAGNPVVELNISDNALGSKGVHAIKNLLVTKTIQVQHLWCVRMFCLCHITDCMCLLCCGCV
jgi:hypothetical protein